MLDDIDREKPCTLDIVKGGNLLMGPEVRGIFKFGKYRGIFRFCYKSSVSGPYVPKKEFFLEEKPGEAYLSWKYQWRGKEKKYGIISGSDKEVYKIKFLDKGRVVHGTWASEYVGKAKFEGREIAGVSAELSTRA